MSTTVEAREDVVVRIYTVYVNNDGRTSEFTVSLSMKLSKAMLVDRDSDRAHAEVHARVVKVMKRDDIPGDLTSYEFAREFLVPADKARPV